MLTFDTWIGDSESEILRTKIFIRYINSCFFERLAYFWYYYHIQSPNQKIPDRKTKCVIKTHINIKQNVIFSAKLKPV